LPITVYTYEGELYRGRRKVLVKEFESAGSDGALKVNITNFECAMLALIQQQKFEEELKRARRTRCARRRGCSLRHLIYSRSSLTLQAFGHSSRDSPTPWIVYHSLTADYRISLLDVFWGAAIENAAQRALILVQLVRECLPLYLFFSDITFKPTFLAVRVP